MSERYDVQAIRADFPILAPACLALNLITMLTGAGLATLAGGQPVRVALFRHAAGGVGWRLTDG